MSDSFGNIHLVVYIITLTPRVSTLLNLANLWLCLEWCLKNLHSAYTIMYCYACTYTMQDSFPHRGMETMIRSQKEVIADLEARIQANTEEISKVYSCTHSSGSRIVCTHHAGLNMIP